jgi:hypothetical protein
LRAIPKWSRKLRGLTFLKDYGRIKRLRLTGGTCVFRNQRACGWACVNVQTEMHFARRLWPLSQPAAIKCRHRSPMTRKSATVVSTAHNILITTVDDAAITRALAQSAHASLRAV